MGSGVFGGFVSPSGGELYSQCAFMTKIVEISKIADISPLLYSSAHWDTLSLTLETYGVKSFGMIALQIAKNKK